MKKGSLLFFILFLSLCSTSSDEGIASLSDDTTTTSVIIEEDYPIVLNQCLNGEKGINVPDPSQQEPKLDLSGLTKSKDEITPLLKECGYGESEYEK